MNFADLPGIPDLWMDFLNSKLQAFSVPASIPELVRQMNTIPGRAIDSKWIRLAAGMANGQEARTAENIERLSRPDAVAIVANVYPGIFGGPAAQILKCLTSVKLSDHLRTHSINAVPVAWVFPEVPDSFTEWETSLVDEDSNLVRFGFKGRGPVPDSMPGLIRQVQELGHGSYDPEALQLLNLSFIPGRTLSSATAILFSKLMRRWGMIAIDSEECGLNLGAEMQPWSVYVLDPFEIQSCIERMPGARILAWPQISATIGNARTRRTFDRYHLDLVQLYAGEKKVLSCVRESLPKNSLSRLSKLMADVDTHMAEVKSLSADSVSLSQTVESTKGKILYQLRKLQNQLETALNTKEQTATKRIRDACTLLAPNGRIQERELAAVQIPLRYSIDGLEVLYERLDLVKFEPQLIWMD